jgi:hypothetical protein
MGRTKERNPLAVPFTIIALASICAAGFLVWYFGFRDTWEEDHGYQIKLLSEDVSSLAASGNTAEAVSKHDELQNILGDRKLVNSQLSSLVAAANSAVAEARAQADARNQAVEAKRRETDSRAAINQLRREAGASAAKGEFSLAIRAYDRAIALFATLPATSPEIDSTRSTILEERAQAAAMLEERNRQTEAARVDAEERAKLASIHATIRGGAWVTKKSGTSEPLRGLDIFFLKTHAQAKDILPLAQAQLEGEKSRLTEANEFLEKVKADQRQYGDFQKFVDSAKKSVDQHNRWTQEAAAFLNVGR